MGMSSAWMRFLATELQIREALRRFHFRIEAHRAAWCDASPEPEEIQQVVAECRDFLLAVDDFVRDETTVWATELRSVLREMEEAARVHADARRTGAIELTVTNGDQATNGWQAVIDDGPEETHTGRTATFRNIGPGKHTLRVRGQITGQQKSVRKNINVANGETTSVDLSLK